MKKTLPLILCFLVLWKLSIAQTGYLKINIYDSNGENEFIFRKIKIIGIDTFNIEINPFEVNKNVELPLGKYKVDLNDVFIKDLGKNKRLLARYPMKEFIIHNNDTTECIFSAILDTISPDTIKFFELFDLNKELLCQGKECIDLIGKRYGIYESYYCNGIGIYSGWIYKVYFNDEVIIEIKTENNQNTYFKLNNHGREKEITFSKVFGYLDVEKFLKDNFTKGELHEKIKIDDKIIE